MQTISIKLNDKQLNNIIKKLDKFKINIQAGTIKCAFKIDGSRINLYNTNVMTIQGIDNKLVYAKIFNEKYIEPIQKNIKQSIKTEFNELEMNSLGSDEVGVGDFFGGLVVCAAYVDTDQIEWLKSIGVKDSKLLKDDNILKIYNQIKNKVMHTTIIASPSSYNAMFNLYKNAHIIKAVMHNKALAKISKKLKYPYFTVIDQFVNYDKYLNYLKQANETAFEINLSLTHAESKYLCVACASIIARVHFLEQINKLSNELNIKLPLGSSNKNIPFIAKQIIKKCRPDKLAKYCKKHFVTYNNIIGE